MPRDKFGYSLDVGKDLDEGTKRTAEKVESDIKISEHKDHTKEEYEEVVFKEAEAERVVTFFLIGTHSQLYK